MKVEIDNHIENFEKPMIVKELLKKLKLNPEQYLVLTGNGEIVTEDYLVKMGETLKIIRVVSGG